MQETHLELGHPGVWRKERRAQSFVPIPWFRRRKWAIGSILLFGVVFVWLYVAGHAPRGLPWGGAPPGVDAEVVELVRTVPGAQPGVSATKHDPLADAGHDGRPYPTREHLLLVLLPQLKQPGFAFADSVWPEWATWVADGRDVPDQLPKDAHLRFLTELKRWTRGIEDVRMVRVVSYVLSSSSARRTGPTSAGSRLGSPFFRNRTVPTRGVPRPCWMRMARITTGTKSICTVCTALPTQMMPAFSPSSFGI